MKTVGLDLGGTKIAAAVVQDGAILEKTRVDTPRSGFADVVRVLADAAASLLDRHPDVDAVGLGSPGPLDFEAGVIRFAPNIPGMENAPLVSKLQELLGLRVALENDANAAGYAEHLYGAGRDLESSIFITISTGIGAGIFIGDRVVRGASGIAGEIGHMIVLPGGPIDGDGHHGTLESIAGGRALAREASYAFGRPMNTKELCELALAGETKALSILDNASRFIGIGIANLGKIVDPAGFVIGGGLSQVDFFMDRAFAYAREYYRGYGEPELRIAQLGTDAGVIGAAAVAASVNSV